MERWWEVWFRYIFAVIAAFVWLYLTSNASLKILSMKDFAISKNVSITFLARILIILVFLVPIVMRIVINWLYSTVYVKYLDVRLTEEYFAYQNTKKAIRSKNKNLCDFRYDGVYKEVFFSADKSQDNVETVLVNKLLDYLSFACKPVRVLELLYYRFSADYRNDNNYVSKGNEETSYGIGNGVFILNGLPMSVYATVLRLFRHLIAACLCGVNRLAWCLLKDFCGNVWRFRNKSVNLELFKRLK